MLAPRALRAARGALASSSRALLLNTVTRGPVAKFSASTLPRALHTQSRANAQQHEAPLNTKQPHLTVVQSATDPRVVVEWADGRTSTL